MYIYFSRSRKLSREVFSKLYQNQFLRDEDCSLSDFLHVEVLIKSKFNLAKF